MKPLMVGQGLKLQSLPLEFPEIFFILIFLLSHLLHEDFHASQNMRIKFDLKNTVTATNKHGKTFYLFSLILFSWQSICVIGAIIRKL